MLRTVGAAALRAADPRRAPRRVSSRRPSKRSTSSASGSSRTPDGAAYELPYDHLVVALGASTNERLIPGSENAFTFKTMADALVLRNHLIEQFERADAPRNQRCDAAV